MKTQNFEGKILVLKQNQWFFNHDGDVRVLDKGEIILTTCIELTPSLSHFRVNFFHNGTLNYTIFETKGFRRSFLSIFEEIR